MQHTVNATDRDGLTVAIDTAKRVKSNAETLIEYLTDSKTGVTPVPPRLHEVVKILSDASAELFDLIKNYYD